MKLLIFALCVNLLTLVNAVNDINFATILKILQPKQRQAKYSNIEETNDPVEVVPIIPGFYLEKQKDLSVSLLENPKTWPDDALAVLSSEETRQSKTNNYLKTTNKGREDNYLNRKILKAVKNLNKYRQSQKLKKNKFKRYKPYANSGKTRKNPVKKMLGRMFKGITGNMYFRQKKINKKPQNRATDDANDAKVLGNLLKNLINGNQNYNKFRENKKHAHYVTEEQSQERGEVLENILKTIQYDNNQGLKAQETEIYQRQPTIIIISNEPLQDDEMEMENNAKESMEDFDAEFGRSGSLNLQTRRSGQADIGGGSASSSGSDATDTDDSSYERNPGNPFTVHKNKYKQNWPYNHYMDGDHMNINPFGPQFGHMGPTGPELFFGRKWWYFNQDDFKPMG